MGPFFGHALPFAGGGDIAPRAAADTVTLHGRVLDGDGAPIPDALLEFWQAGPDGRPPAAPGSMRRDHSTGRDAGRDGVTFTGWGRVPTDADGHYAVRTLRPPAGAPYLGVLLLARGLLHHLHTRAYLPEAPHDALLASLPPARRATLVARHEDGGVYRFDIRIQGDDAQETVFLEFR
ncbi:protocatechuate 3,4-dioxygenase subunit alpha [Actinacidiphila reveromycinica]|uniref:protocatechuate 3,4-dioxygenase subunit alpha n=1 Tax=Actinacidiphila reveromycinica TaxID=659352 RepID=UPI001F0055B4|nr:protocatechuate 3,4-dioxygenase subunit alpha [Streptomyces sp. SN-593]